MSMLRVLRSGLDPSVNVVEPTPRGFFESRYVRRCADYFVAYLSSHDGCNRGCAMCHLTATGQTSMGYADADGFAEQAGRVFDEYDAAVAAGAPSARYMHYAFMARGEPLANPAIVGRSDVVLSRLHDVARRRSGLPVKLCVSTIMPRTLDRSLVQVFPYVQPTIYYSLYSLRGSFRERWLPGAMPAERALELLAEYQRFSKKIVKIHYALIAGENDTDWDAAAVCDAIARWNLAAEVNLVRYNPADAGLGAEPAEAEIQRYASQLRRGFPGLRVKVVDRVGADVHASCGTFVTEAQP